MFTGIVEMKGTVVSVTKTDTGERMTIEANDLGSMNEGASIAVNGVCLTAIGPVENRVDLDIVPETLARTSLGSATPGSLVNLERAMGADGRFDGHIVQGHVDGTGEVMSVDRIDGGVVMRISLSDELDRYVVEKGSVTVDGVSLTVAAVSPGSFEVALIPHTLEVTTLGLRNVGDVVNLETDVLAKYVERMIEARE